MDVVGSCVEPPLMDIYYSSRGLTLLTCSCVPRFCLSLLSHFLCLSVCACFQLHPSTLLSIHCSTFIRCIYSTVHPFLLSFIHPFIFSFLPSIFLASFCPFFFLSYVIYLFIHPFALFFFSFIVHIYICCLCSSFLCSLRDALCAVRCRFFTLMIPFASNFSFRKINYYSFTLKSRLRQPPAFSAFTLETWLREEKKERRISLRLVILRQR